MVLEKTRFLRRCVGVGCCLSGLLLLLGARSEEDALDEGADVAAAQETVDQASSGAQIRLIRVPLPITGNTDIRVKQAVDQAVREFPKGRDRSTLVFEFWAALGSGDGSGSEFERCLSLARHLASESLRGVRTVAYVPRTLRGHAVLAVLACEEIIMAPTAEFGDAGIDEKSIDPTMRRGYSEIADRRRTFPTAVALGMLDRSLSVLRVETAKGVQFILEEDLDQLEATTDVKTLIPREQMGRFTGEALRIDYGFVSHWASDRVELANTLQVSPDQLELDPSLDGGWKPIRLELSGPITPLTVNHIQRTIATRIRSGDVNFICLGIDSAGGQLAESMRLAQYLASLDPSRVRTVAFVETQARGDAALIALACDHLVMHEEAVLGGSGTAEWTEDEIVNARRAIQDLAATKSRRWSLIASVIDPQLRVYRYSLDGSDVVQFFCDDELAQQSDPSRWSRGAEVTADGPFQADGLKAASMGLARFVASSLAELQAAYQLEMDLELVEPSWVHDAVDALAAPHVAGTLLFFAGIALVAEFMTPGIGVGGFVSLLCFGLYFWSQFLHGNATALEMMLFVIGIACVLVEVFVVPGFGIFGLGGGGLIIASLVLASQTFVLPTNAYQYQQLPRSILMVAAAGGGILTGLVVLRRFIPQAPFLQGVILETPSAEDIEEQQRREALVQWDHLLGRRGIATTPLLPGGKARFDQEVVNVISDGEAVSQGAAIIVTEVSGNRIVVRPTT